jgi:2-oxoisovalerate dehydrogenase E2 component (dihydrolipoyl transacylase)
MRRFIEPGAQIEQFEKLCEVQSDKATVEITSRYDGKVVKLHYKPGDVAKVGAPLVDIDTGEAAGDDEAVEESVKVEPTLAKQSAPQSSTITSVQSEFKTLATPAVRRIAMENDVDLVDIQGSGKAGRVTKEDILAHVEGLGSAKSTPSVPSKRAFFT